MREETQIQIGVNPKTGLTLYRNFIAFNAIKHQKRIVVHYEEYMRDKNGDIFNETFKNKTYILEEENGGYQAWAEKKIEKDFVGLTLNEFFTGAINQTLSNLPLDVENEYIIKTQN